MENEKSIDELLDQLIWYWGAEWGDSEKYYLETLAPQLAANPETGTDTERPILESLRRQLSDKHWQTLPDLIRQRRQSVQSLKDQEVENERQRIKKEEREAQEAEQRELEEKEANRRRAAEIHQAVGRVSQYFESSFLKADEIYQKQFSSILPRDVYLQQKASFVKNWVRKNGVADPDLEQAAAIGCFGSHVQVTARAGSGKTTTLINRAIFLCKHCNVRPKEILLLAFNKKAVEEIVHRLGECFDAAIPHVMTFHALAYAIVHPEEAILYDNVGHDDQPRSRALQNVIDDYLRDPEFKAKIRELMLENFRADWEKIVSGGYDRGKSELIEYRKSLPTVSLGGNYVKSYGEKLIADFLFENGIDYRYEQNHRWSGINYRPDFTIYLSSDSGLIIEYFGMKGDPEYDESVAQKRLYWEQKKSWTLIEIESGEVAVGQERFQQYLERILLEHKVPFNPLSEDELWLKLRDRAIDGFTRSAVGFIQRCRKLSLTPDQLHELVVSSSHLSDVEVKFHELSHVLYAAYLERVAETGEDDFDGLMQKAVVAIQGGETVFKRKSGGGDIKDISYVFIDEFQDFSELFYKLIQSINSKNDQIEYFCVGDDWQAINGFAGSDLKYFEDYEQYYSPSTKLNIPTNYRSTKEIVNVGNSVMGGYGSPARSNSKHDGLVMVGNLDDFNHSTREKELHTSDQTTPAVLRLLKKFLIGEKNVVLLTRTNNLPGYIYCGKDNSRNKNGIEAWADHLRSCFPEEVRGRIRTSTAHKYKGLQSDVVIVLDAVYSRYPHIHPAWVFNRIIGDTLDGVVEEDRRLFYVALTRAIDTLIILTEKDKISPFLEDLIRECSLDWIKWNDYPEVREEGKRLTVRVKSADGANKGTYEIKDQLKANKYNWQSVLKAWCRSYPKDQFNLQLLKQSIWSAQASDIIVEIVDDTESVTARYIVQQGIWSSKRLRE